MQHGGQGGINQSFTKCVSIEKRFHAHWKDVEYENYQNKGISKGLKQTMTNVSLILNVNMEHD